MALPLNEKVCHWITAVHYFLGGLLDPDSARGEESLLPKFILVPQL